MRLIVIDVEKGIRTCEYSRGRICEKDARFKIRKIRKTAQSIIYLCLKHYKQLYPTDSAEYLMSLVSE